MEYKLYFVKIGHMSDYKLIYGKDRYYINKRVDPL